MLDFLKEDIKRFELNDSKATYLIAIGIAKMFPPPINAFIAIPFSLLLLAEFFPKLNAILGLGIAIVCLGAAGKITHFDILGLSSNTTILVGLGVLSIGVLWSLLANNFQFNKLYLGFSFIVLLTGIGFKITHLELYGTSGNTIIILSAMLISISYLYRFLLKVNKDLIDVLKVLIVWSYAAGYCLTILHQYYAFEIMLINSVLLLIWALLYFYKKNKSRKPKF